MDLDVLDFALEEELPLGVLEVFDSILAQLSSLEELPLISENSPWADQMVEKIQSCKSGLRFLRMFFWSLSTLEDTDAEIRHILIPVTYEIFAFSSLKNTEHKIVNWILDLQGRIQIWKQKFEESCELILQYSLRCNSFKSNEMTLYLLDAVLQNMKDLYKIKADDEVLLLNNQIASLEKKVTLLHNLFNRLTPVQWIDFMEMQAFKVVVHVFAQCSANLVFLFWAEVVDEEMATKLNLLLFNVMQKYKPCVQVFKAVYIRFLEETKLRQLDSLLLGQIIQVFLDLLLENLVDILKDDFLILQESLVFLISFLAQPPEEHGEDEDRMMMITKKIEDEGWMTTITAEIEVLVKEDLYRVLSVDDMNGNFSEANTCLGDFTRKVELVKGKIQQVYDQVPGFIFVRFPKD